MLLFIHTVNRNFHARDDGVEYDSPEKALTAGVQTGLVIASDEIGRGEDSAAVEVRIERRDGSVCLRSMVAVVVASLLPVAHSSGDLPPLPKRPPAND